MLCPTYYYIRNDDVYPCNAYHPILAMINPSTHPTSLTLFSINSSQETRQMYPAYILRSTLRMSNADTPMRSRRTL